ncbi:DUF221-domain-containing protein, partial [Rhizodiscina lignyota]
AGAAQEAAGQTISTFLGSLGSALAIFGAQIFLFYLLRNKFTRIYRPKTYLVSEKDRTTPPPGGLWRWVVPVFRTSSAELISKCGLDAYFFLRYLQMLLKIFVPTAVLFLPILIPMNHAYRGAKTIKGLDKLGWQNYDPAHTDRFWTHLVLACTLLIWTFYVITTELRGYIRVRQAYLTSPQHRLRASATTVLVTSIPRKWLTYEALDGLYDVFPGGIRNIWINRNFDELNEKVNLRDKLARMLEGAETALVKKAKAKQMEMKKKEEKEAGKKRSKPEKARLRAERDSAGLRMAEEGGVSSGNPHQAHTLDETLGITSDSSSEQEETVNTERSKALPIPIIGQGLGTIGHGLGAMGQGFTKFGKNIVGEVMNVPKAVNDRLDAVNDGYVVDGPADFNTDRTLSTSQNPQDTVRTVVPVDKLLSIFSKRPKDEDEVKEQYPVAFNEEFADDQGLDADPEWKKYLSDKDRASTRLPLFGLSWLPHMPSWTGIGKKVDLIYYCRKELARLNLEIEQDQQEPEKYPLMNSAFIQFNHQVAAHMACQSVSHHVPLHMAPRIVEIAPDDVIWDNLSIKWWERLLRVGVVFLLISGLIIAWVLPVSFTSAISNLSWLGTQYKSLSWILKMPKWLISALQGVLPFALLGILLALLPVILRLASRLQGVHTGMAVELSVQGYYFGFLFVQVFLVVTISTSIYKLIPEISQNPTRIAEILAQNIPRASDYFFSYMLLQALSVSAGSLAQIGTLVLWFLWRPIADNTARQKFNRQLRLPNVRWGTFFPVYTNLACIGLIYSVIAPLILVFNIITFTVFWVSYRYQTLYVNQSRFDTGGLLFPRAVNQLFTGIYVMEVALIGLFFLVRNERGTTACVPQAIIMIVVFLITVLFQTMVNYFFSPLYRYIPITLEDDAVARDEEFARANGKKWEGVSDGEEGEDIEDALERREREEENEERLAEEAEAAAIKERRKSGGGLAAITRLNTLVKKPFAATRTRTSWADRSQNKRPNEVDERRVSRQHFSPEHKPHHHHHHRPAAPEKDLEAGGVGAGHAAGDALFGSFHDVIEDLTPEERDRLIQRAFLHKALQARRPVIWIPRDDLGVSDDEVRRTQKFSDKIWISNEFTGLDRKGRVVFRRAPPDFSEVDLIEL